VFQRSPVGPYVDWRRQGVAEVRSTILFRYSKEDSFCRHTILLGRGARGLPMVASGCDPGALAAAESIPGVAE